MVRTTLVALALASIAGCSCSRRAVLEDAGTPADAAPRDAIAIDAADDGGQPDGGPVDAGRVDGGRDAAVDGGRDAGGDAGRDAGPAPVDAGSFDAGSGPCVGCVTYQCAPAIAGNELMSGLALSPMFSPGMRFEVPAGGDRTLRTIELDVRSSDPSASTVFAAVTRLTGMSDTPDTGDFTGADTIGVVLVPVPPASSMSVTLRVPTTLRLAPGWYALAFGTGAHGATLTDGTIHSNGDPLRCTDGSFPFSVRRSDSAFNLQAASPHFLVELEPAP